MFGNTIRCEWADCQITFNNLEDLYNHLSDDHVGRKSTNNLCLTCQWNNCGTISAKRDHLASHLRVHLPFKPHECLICHKGFKRPQDLKKHERIHTSEHKASLLSNQPDYKPVRRRRKNVNGSTATSTRKTLKSSEMSPKEFSAKSSDLSSCSPSFSFGDSMSSNDFTYKNMDLDEDNLYDTSYLNDPFQNFIDDVLQNQALPNYDAEIIYKLNSIAPILQCENNNWSLPCEPEAIPALQNWLEQLSANIKNESPMMTADQTTNLSLTPPNTQDISQCHSPSSKSEVQILLNDDYDLYPKVNSNNNLWNDPTTPFVPQQQQHYTPPASESSALYTPPMDDMKPQLWSPEYIHSPLYNTKQQEQPEIITPTFEKQVESPVYFETGLTRSNPVMPSIDSSSMVSFDNKKDIMHMMNVFSSSDDIKYKSKQEDNQQVTSTTTSSITITEIPTTSDEQVIEYPSLTENLIVQESLTVENNDQSLYPKSPMHENDDDEDYSGSEYSEEEDDIESPYANLVELVGKMNIEDEQSMKKRHILLIDQLLQAISRVA